MPIKIIADYRELLIDIFFAIVIAVGLDRFFREFLIIHLTELKSFDLESIFQVFYTSIRFDMFFFFAAYFWVISHWVFYHELITKYPYYRWPKFFVDITLFSIMFIMVNISFEVDKNAFTLIFVWLLIVWHAVAYLWHLSDIGLRPLRHHLWIHTQRLMTYIPLLLFLYHPLSADPTSPLYRYNLMIAIILAMIFWSLDRLRRFLYKDSRVYFCKYLDGYPGRNLPKKEAKEGRLVLIKYPMSKEIGSPKKEGLLKLIKYPMSKKIDDNGKDIIKFEGNKFDAIKINAEDIIDVGTERMSKFSNRSDLVLWINCKFPAGDRTGYNIKVLFNPRDEIIASVRKGIEELAERNKHGDSI